MVAGPHRSGTSLVTGLLGNSVGVLPTELMRPALSNSKGFNESWSIVHFNESIFREMGLTWDSVEPTGKQIFKESFKKRFYSDCLDCLRENFPESAKEESGSIVLKDPRFCRTFPIWKKALLDLHYEIKVVIPLRSPIDVMHSLMKRDDIDAASAVLIWYWHIVEILVHSEGMDVRFVSYDRLLDNPREHMQKCLDVKINEQVSSMVDKKLDHSKSNTRTDQTMLDEEPFNSSVLLYENLSDSPIPDARVLSDIKRNYLFQHVLRANLERKSTVLQNRLIKEISLLNGLTERENKKRFKTVESPPRHINKNELGNQENEGKSVGRFDNLWKLFK